MGASLEAAAADHEKSKPFRRRVLNKVGLALGLLNVNALGDKKSLMNKMGALIFRWVFSDMLKDKKKELHVC